MDDIVFTQVLLATLLINNEFN
uniref:Uncharacterized protein n=1 Tax=Arundo donax TaxID=35708 RepID=A0A0A9ACL5_ARUDO